MLIFWPSLYRWYRRSELAFRLSLYIVMAPLAGAFGGLLASGILSLDHFGSLTTWRMIFGIEGVITIGLSLIAFFTLTDRPETARWLTAEEKELAIARVKSERVGTTMVLDKIDKKKLLLGIFNPVTLATSFIFLLDNITVQGLAFFAPTIVKTIYPHQSVVHQQLRTVPPYVVGAFATVLIPYISTKTDRRTIYFIASAPLMMIGYIMFLATDDASTRYGATFIIAVGAFSYGALCMYPIHHPHPIYLLTHPPRQRPSLRQRRFRHCAVCSNRSKRHGWELWRAGGDVVVFALGQAELPYR